MSTPAKPAAGEKPWSGRFSESTDAFVEAFTASQRFDRRLAPWDIRGSIAHARMLAHVGVLTGDERDALIAGLEEIAVEIADGGFRWSDALEDVHMHIEARLVAKIGATGKKLHTARSRNDQIATDLRLWLRDEIDAVAALIERLQQALLALAEREAETVMPGFTHLQIAQPVTFGHHMLAWFEMVERDRQRLADCRRRVNVMPLGAAALAGGAWPVDRVYAARLLGFDAAAENSLDAVSDRDFAIEFAAFAALLMTHLSRLSEELILWNSAQFGFIDLPDRFCTGSSIMPQKKNPDVPELVRGKTGRVCGDLMALLTLMKGQPLAYNKDNQEDKEPLFDAVDTVKGCLRAYAELLPALTVRRDAMRAAAQCGFSTATDLADWLARRGLPFRDAHEVVGRAVRLCVDSGRALTDLSLDEFRALSPLIDEGVYAILSVDGSVAARDHLGGTAPAQVRAAIERARRRRRET